jgi:hypothetical protein
LASPVVADSAKSSRDLFVDSVDFVTLTTGILRAAALTTDGSKKQALHYAH